MPSKRETLVCDWCEGTFTRPVTRGRKPLFCCDEHREEARMDRTAIDLEESNRELKSRLRLAKKIISNSNIRPRKGMEVKVHSALQKWHAA